MTSIERHSSTAKVMHNGVLTQKERLTYFDDEEAAIVPTVLAGDECFREKARTIAARDPEDRRAEAEREAKSYAPNRGSHRDLIVELLLIMAAEPWRRKEIPPLVFFANRHRRAVWADSPLDDFDPRRARARWVMLKEGAHGVARLGAFKCIHCGRPLGHDRYDRGASRRRSRRTHCGQCWGNPRIRRGIRSQLDAMRKALDAATGQRRRQRARRRLA
jgi:hypothetical protein